MGETHPGRELQTDVLGNIALGPAPALHTSLFRERCYNLSPFIASTHTFARSSRKKRFKERSSFHWPDGLSPRKTHDQDLTRQGTPPQSPVERGERGLKNQDPG